MILFLVFIFLDFIWGDKKHDKKKTFILIVTADFIKRFIIVSVINGFWSARSSLRLNNGLWILYFRSMATVNLTGDGEQKTFEQLACSAVFAAKIDGHLTFISVLSIFLSITTFLGNALILAALRKESSLHPPSKLLLRNLATTDLCVGFISEPLFVTYLMSIVNKQWYIGPICPFIAGARLITDFTLCGVSLYTLTAISVDRLLALLLGLKYRQVVTLKRTYVIIIAFWVASIAFSTMYIWNSLTRKIALWYSLIVMFLCLLTSFFSYTKIFLNLRHYQNQAQHLQQPNQANQLNIARYKKAVFSALWLQLTLVACYLPMCVVTAFLLTTTRLSSSVLLAAQYASIVVFLNSSLNPILYCWKIDEVRQAVKDTIRQVLCCSSS